MHPRLVTLMAFADGELDSRRHERIQAHIDTCERCAGELRRIQHEKWLLCREGLAESAVGGVLEQGLAGIMTAITGWKESQSEAERLKLRTRNHLETYFGFCMASDLTQGAPDTETLSRARSLLATFLGKDSAASVIRQISSSTASAGVC